MKGFERGPRMSSFVECWKAQGKSAQDPARRRNKRFWRITFATITHEGEAAAPHLAPLTACHRRPSR